MDKALEIIAGDVFNEPPDHERIACINELEPVIRSLMQQGMRTGSIIAALAHMTVLTANAQQRN